MPAAGQEVPVRPAGNLPVLNPSVGNARPRQFAESPLEGIPMRIHGSNPTSTVSTPSTPRRTGTTTFELGGNAPPRAAGAAAAPRSVGGIDALLALQGLEDATERRRRGVKRGRRALDALDALKLALLDGGLDAHAVARLKAAAVELGESTGEPGLDGVLAEIALRAEVELAKIGMSQHSE
jgi:hypothetical protein